jgi:hypothetical protein
MWDVLTGIRGVDEDTSEVARDKINHLTNHRVRAVTGLIPLHPGKPEKRLRSFNDTPLTEEQQKKRDKHLEKVPKHFRDHYEKAVKGVKALYDWDLKNETPVNHG